MLDGVEPNLVDKINSEASHVKGVVEVNEIRVRRLGPGLQQKLISQ